MNSNDLNLCAFESKIQFKCKAEKLAKDGSAVVSVIESGALNGKKYFVQDAAPGDLLLCKVKDEKKHIACIEEILEASCDRCNEFCTYCLADNIKRCGGCTLQHINYDASLKYKLQLLQDTLIRNCNICELPFIKVVASKKKEFRNRIQLHSIVNAGTQQKRNIYKLDLRKTEKQNFGFMPRHGNSIIPIDDCPICDPIIRSALQERTLKAPLDKDRFTIYGKDNLLLSEAENPFGVYNICGKQIKISANSFFQSNGDLLELLIKDILTIADKADHNLPCGDFYCGVGTFAAFLQDIFLQIILFDQNKSAVAIAAENVRSAGAEFFAVDDDKFVRSNKIKKQFGLAVADPARTGFSPLMCKWFCENKPKILCYISCNPAALARDAKQLLANSYKLQSLTYYDFYPYTAHIEALAVFTICL